MQNRLISSLLLLAILTLAACQNRETAHMPASDGEALWKFITTDSTYTRWSHFPEHKGKQPGNAPHGLMQSVYANDIALQSKNEAEPGSIIVKENYNAEGTKVMALTVMYKVEGFNPDAGDWFWAKYSPAGDVQASGAVGGCINCHTGVADNDYTFVHKW